MKIDITILITSYNYATYIEGCINSCLEQDDSPFKYEVLVIDDGSTDETSTILGNLNSGLLRKFRIENSGIEIASNFGFKKARGAYVVRLDADDKLLPNYLYSMHKNVVQGYDFYYPDYEIINSEGKVVGEMKLPEFVVAEIHERGDFLATGTLYPAQVLKDFGYYSEEIKNSGLENYELILRMLQTGRLGKHIPTKLFSYRRHSRNLSISKRDQIIRNGEVLFRRLGLGGYTSNKYHPYNLI